MRSGSIAAAASLLLLLLASLICSVESAGRCERWGGEPSFCLAFSGYHEGIWIFSANYSTSLSLDERTNLLTEVYRNYLALEIPRECRKALQALLCGLYLRPCVNSSDYGLLAYPVEPCRSVCFLEVKECADRFAALGIPNGYGAYLPSWSQDYPITCTKETDPALNNATLFPEGEYTIHIGNATENVSCNSMATKKDIHVKQYECFFPLQWAEDGSACGFTCPLPQASGETIGSIEITESVISWISWATSLFMIVSYLIHRKLRRFPSNMVLMAAISCHLVAWGPILPGFFPKQEVICGANGDNSPSTPEKVTTPAFRFADGFFTFSFDDALTFFSSLCTVQGVLLQYSLMASTLWWALLGFNSFLQLYFVATGIIRPLGEWYWKRRLQILYFLIGWGVPALFTVLPAVQGGCIGLVPSSTYCFVSSGCAYQYWVAPMGGILFLGSLFYILTMIQAITIERRQSQRAFKLYLPFFIRIVVFSILYWLLFLFLLSYEIYLIIYDGPVTRRYQDYFFCLLLSPNCQLDGSEFLRYFITLIHSLAVADVGLLLFLTFTTKVMFKGWLKLLLRVRDGVLWCCGCCLPARVSASLRNITTTRGVSRRKEEGVVESKRKRWRVVQMASSVGETDDEDTRTLTAGVASVVGSVQVPDSLGGKSLMYESDSDTSASHPALSDEEDEDDDDQGSSEGDEYGSLVQRIGFLSADEM